LLESQASFLADDALYALESSRCRIYAMSLIHQKFYQSNNIRSIEIRSYISELVLYLTESFGFPANVRTTVDVPEINLSISNAIPVGLIINEAVNNAYKYAFPNEREGEIAISVKVTGTKISLEIRDNGIGIPFDPANPISDSLGIELMKGLATDLKGAITFIRGNGTGIVVTFQFEPVANSFNELSYA
jgi:two-component sensor histidine kinase